jgi:hypothetical protein
MALKYLSNLDLGGLEVKNLRLENFSTTNQPTGSASGHVYYNTTTNKIRVYDGTNWKDVGLTLVGGTGISIAADGVTISVDSTVVSTSGAQTIAGVKTFSDNMVINGNLTVSGDYTITAPETVAIQDNILLLNSNVTTGDPTEDAGLEVSRGGSDNVALLWDESAKRWTFTNDGSTYYDIPQSDEYNNYTYNISCSTVTGGVNFNLNNPATSTTDSIKFAGGGDVTVTQASDVITITADTHTDNEIKDLAGGVLSNATKNGIDITYNTSTHAAAFTNHYVMLEKDIDGSGAFQTFTASALGIDLTSAVIVQVYENSNDHYKMVLTEVQIDTLNDEIDRYLANGVSYRLYISGVRA